jgi:hypothetical protein
MRGIIIRSVSPEDAQSVRRLLAIEGYVYLGMFEEAEEELRGLSPSWFAFEGVLKLQSRVCAGLSSTYKTR